MYTCIPLAFNIHIFVNIYIYRYVHAHTLWYFASVSRQLFFEVKVFTRASIGCPKQCQVQDDLEWFGKGEVHEALEQ